MNTSSFPKILMIATWFGPLPEYFSLWVMSCRYNPDIDWLLVTDAPLPNATLPDNLHVRVLSMIDFARKIESAIGFPISFVKPYKSCDYRPVFSCLLNLVPGHWDFWGHCDLDMLYGNIRAFLTKDILMSNDRVFGVGHFSIYRNCDKANNFYRRPCPDIDYKAILSASEHYGFDEHIGVNRIWRHHGGRFHEDESILADIDPHIKTFHRTSNYIRVNNSRLQVFAFDRGRVIRYYLKRGRVKTDEFMYIHFQKRRFVLQTPPESTDRVWITPRGFVQIQASDVPPSKTLVKRLNPRPIFPPRDEFAYQIRRNVRIMGRKLKQLLK